MQCVPQGEMGRTRGVSMTKFKMSKADLQNEVHLCYLHQVPAAAMPPPPPVSQGSASNVRTPIRL